GLSSGSALSDRTSCRDLRRRLRPLGSTVGCTERPVRRSISSTGPQWFAHGAPFLRRQVELVGRPTPNKSESRLTLGMLRQGDRTILIIPLSWCRTGSTAASAAELEPGTRAHASVLQRLAACPTAPAWTPCQASESTPGLSASRAESRWGPQRRRCATG